MDPNCSPAHLSCLCSLRQFVRDSGTASDETTVNELIAARVPIYLEGREADLRALHQALARDDLRTIRKIAHDMKGTGSSYGFDGLTDIGGRLEAAANRDDRTAVGTCLAALSKYLDGVRTSKWSDSKGAAVESHIEARDPADA